jgi:glycosyltransferase involved in cell wall biosynthesis
LRNLDVCFTPSLWEGFNLPLVEAQAAGTLGVAFDTGAHPEVTPMLFSDMRELLAAIERYADDRHLLWSHSKLCYHFVRDRFSWSRASQQAIELLSS